ncbi:MAG: 30S ribosomal protein S7 [Parcubacteria group bacterium CG10_big_fil_rev_8_21_14_0_10_36_14]|nr:MAG: 30S ribosomal protein S7 [Parcubacteria group bacterium CG10_big_fil_rev_8_21_14_0_10_36_14]
MRGKKKAPKRKIKPDVKYSNLQVAKFINYLMGRGKKTVAQAVLYDALDIISEKTKEDSLVVFETAIKNVSPQLEIRSKRVGGANYQIPFPVKGDRKFALASRWILGASRDKKGRRMAEKLAEELMAAAKNEGTAIKKKEDVQRMAEANRAFAHFAR